MFHSPPIAPGLKRAQTVSALVAGVLWCWVLWCGSAAAGENATAADGRFGIFSLMVENDLVTGTDRHFTHGMQMRWLSPEGRIPGWADDLARAIPLLDAGGRKRVALALGQNMYTPSDIGRPVPDPVDRPYGGWLYGAAALISETDDRFDTVELDIGVVGPASLAGPVQKRWHALIGAPRPQGWVHQLSNEPGFALLWERKWRRGQPLPFLGLEVDAMPHVAASLGNIFTYGAGGLTLRLGDDLKDDYGAPRIRPALPGSAYFSPGDGIGWYVFAGFEARAVARDIFLDGNSFTDSPDVVRRPLVGDFQIGFALTFERVRLTYSHVIRTREFESQRGPDRFGALSLSLSF